MKPQEKSPAGAPGCAGQNSWVRTGIIILVLACIGIAGLVAAFSAGTPSGSGHTTAGAATPANQSIPAGTSALADPAATTVPSSCRPLTITQTDGREVSFSCMPQRIIAANANAAEMLIALGAEDRIVGATDSTLAVPYIRDKIPSATSIGDWQTPNIEQIMALRPDVVISYSSYRPKNIDQILLHNVTIVSLDCYKLSTLASDARALGKLTGRSNEAEVYARMVENTIAEVATRVKALPAEDRPTVYFESYTDLTASAPGSGADELLTGAGGTNTATGTMTSSTKVSAEWVVAQKPDFIFKAVSSSNTRTLPEIVTGIKTREGLQDVPAVKNDRVYAFLNDIIYGPRSYIGLVYTAQILHPAQFRDMHPRAMLDAYEQTYVAGTNRTGMIYP